jgi:hypothetical protein
MAAWEAQVAADPDGQSVAWSSKPVTAADRVTADKSSGTFAGVLAGKAALAPAATYWCRARQQGKDKTWSAWSPWHQALVTEKDEQNR